jgi:hypothetical protein
MKAIPRRKLMNGVYLESDRDYVMNNLDLAVKLLDAQVAKQKSAKRSKSKA